MGCKICSYSGKFWIRLNITDYLSILVKISLKLRAQWNLFINVKHVYFDYYSFEALSWAELYCGALVFYNSKNLNCIGALSFYGAKMSIGEVLFIIIQRIWIVLGRCLFLISVHTFSWFLKSNLSSDFGDAETGSGAKKRVVLGRDIFCSNFKVEWEIILK